MSDLLQISAEFGLFGLVLLAGSIGIYLYRLAHLGRFSLLAAVLLVGCAAVLSLACIDVPFMSPAVTISFLLMAFSALRWSELGAMSSDEIDAARPTLVTPESQRLVPFSKTKR
jgi:hypothetical protein